MNNFIHDKVKRQKPIKSFKSHSFNIDVKYVNEGQLLLEVTSFIPCIEKDDATVGDLMEFWGSTEEGCEDAKNWIVNLPLPTKAVMKLKIKESINWWGNE